MFIREQFDLIDLNNEFVYTICQEYMWCVSNFNTPHDESSDFSLAYCNL